jgi:hypothetical protein
MAVENMRLAVIAAPVTAAPSVADRAVQANKPSSVLKPRVQIATDGAWAAHQRAWNITSIATTGTTNKRTAFDCHLSFNWSTPHRIVLHQEALVNSAGRSVYTQGRATTMHFTGVQFFLLGRPS